MNKKISVSTAITIAIIAMTVTFSVTMILARQIFERTIPSVKEKESMYSKIAEIDKYTRANYFGEISDETLNDMIGYGYVLGTGDKNAKYYTARQFKELLDIQNGDLIGIGVDLAKDSSGYGRITAIYDGSPAEELGMQVGGFITSVDGNDTKAMSKEAMITKLRGEAGTEVSVGYMAPDTTTNSFTLNRSSYIVPSVEYSVQDDAIGYIRIYRFDSTTLKQFSRAVNDLQEKSVKAMVIDLRDNGGGLLSAAVDCLDLLIPRGEVVWAEYKDGERKLLGESDSSSVDLPFVVMVNRETASSAELFAATLREYTNAKLIGENTMGKGTIQAEPYRMSDGSAVVITVARMLTGKGASFDGTGLTVDLELIAKPSTENSEGENAADNMIQQAVVLAKVDAGIPVAGDNQNNASSQTSESGSSTSQPESNSTSDTVSSSDSDAA